MDHQYDEQTSCRWWQRHLWSKWTYTIETFICVVCSQTKSREKFREMKEYKTRYCSRCGVRKKVFVDSWQDDGPYHKEKNDRTKKV